MNVFNYIKPKNFNNKIFISFIRQNNLFHSVYNIIVIPFKPF